MAKGNLFLGNASRSVGDVTMYVRDGAQISRRRARSVANPRSFGQAKQRAFFSPVARFYSPLSTCLERSYEGLNRTRSYSAFLKKNIDLARTNGWYLPKGAAFFPLPYQLSRGTIQPVPYEFGNEALQLLTAPGARLETVGDLSRLFIDNLGYKAGQQVTIITVGLSEAGDYFPAYARFILNAASTVSLSDAVNIPGISIDAGAGPTAGRVIIYYEEYHTLVAGAIIVSEWDANKGIWTRSTQYLACSDDIMARLRESATAIDSYQKDGSTPTSDVYLNDGSSLTINDGSLAYYTFNDISTVFLGSPWPDNTDVVVANGDFSKRGQKFGSMVFQWGNGGDNAGKVLAFVDGSYAWVAVPASWNFPDDIQTWELNSRYSTYEDVVAWLQQQGVPASLFT